MYNFPSYLLRFIFLLLLFSKGALANDVEYSYVPKKVYEKQVFPISFLTTSNKEDKIRFEFGGGKVPILNEPVVIKNGSKTFYTFYFKTTESLFEIPVIRITLKGKSKNLPRLKIPVEQLPVNKAFSGVIASGLKIKSYQASVYDETTNLIAISLEAYDANLEDMYVPDALKDGLENLNRTGSKMEAQYYIVLPSEQTRLKFSYFDTIKHTFIDKEIPISIDDGSVAAQTDLNPQDDSFEVLKKYILVGMIVIFMLLFLWKRDYFYLILGVISAVILLTFFMPLAKVCVKAGSALYIVPSSNSTISVYIDKEIQTTNLAQRNEYIKIEYKNGVIGWIKNENICNP